MKRWSRGWRDGAGQQRVRKDAKPVTEM